MHAARSHRATVLLVVALTTGCRIIPEARPDRTRFYTLGLPAPSGSGSGRQLALGLGPITFPAYLEQPQLVTRVDEERVVFAPTDRWAGSLRGQFERALMLRLMSALGTDDVTVFPWWPGRRIDVTVQLSVLAFEADSSGTARLDALWRVKDGQREQLLDTGQARVREPIGSGGAPAEVEALGRALDQLADAIAGDVTRARR